MVKDKALLYDTEAFNFEKAKDKDKDEEKIIISGQAMPIGKKSRNGVNYRPESVKKAVKTLEKAPFLFNHNTDISLGHITEADSNEKGIEYKADIDPEEKNYLRKVERGDIRHVSVGAMVSNPEFDEETGEVTVDVDEFVELSAVPVPGFKDTSSQVNNKIESKSGALYLAETFGNEEMKEKLKQESQNKEKDEDEEESESKDEKTKDTPTQDNSKGEDEEKSDDSNSEKTSEEPFAGYKNFDDCVKKNKDKEDPKGYCASIKKKAEKDQKPDQTEEDEEDEQTKLEKLGSQVEEISSQLTEFSNRVAILETKVDSLVEGEENSEDQTDDNSEDEKEKPEEKLEENYKEDEKNGKLTDDKQEAKKGQDENGEKWKEDYDKPTESEETKKNKKVDLRKNLLKNKSY